MKSSSSESTLYPRLSGRLSTRLPMRRCDGVRGSSKSLDVMYDRGLELMIDSVSTIAVCSSSSESLACPTIFLSQRLVDFTILSNTPPHHGALSRLNFHSMPRLDRCSSTTSSLNTTLMNFAAALNVFPSSDTNLRGIPLLAANHFGHLRNVSADRSVTMSRCTARVTQHVLVVLARM